MKPAHLRKPCAKCGKPMAVDISFNFRCLTCNPHPKKGKMTKRRISRTIKALTFHD